MKYTYLNRYACSKLAQQRLMRQDGPRVTRYERPAVYLSTLSYCHSHKKQMNLVQVCYASSLSRLGRIVQDFVEYFNTVPCRMSTKLKCTYLKRYACSKLAQQRLMRQDGPRVTHQERPAAYLSTLSHWHSHKKHMNLVQVFAISPLFPG